MVGLSVCQSLPVKISFCVHFHWPVLVPTENINDRLFDEWISLKIDTGGLIANLVKTKECATIVDGWLKLNVEKYTRLDFRNTCKHTLQIHVFVG